MNGSEKRILWTACANHGMIHVFELAVPALLIQIQSTFLAGDLEMGRIVTIYGLLFGLGALPAGIVVDRIGSRRLLLFCLWGASLSVIGMAWSPGLTAFGIWAALMGLCLSAYHPAGTALITQALPLSARTLAVHGISGNLGVAGSAVLVGSLGALLGWRWALTVLAGIGLVLGAQTLALPAGRAEPTRREAPAGSIGSFLILLVAITFVGMVYRGLTTFLPKFLGTRLAEEASTATALGGAFTTLALVAGLGGMHVAGRMVDRVGPGWTFLAGTVLQAPMLIVLGIAVDPALVPLAMGVAFFHFMTQPAGNYMVAAFTPAHLRGLGFGLYFFLSFGAGSTGALIGGWISESQSLSRVFPWLAVLLIPAAVAALALALTTPRGGGTASETDASRREPSPAG